ncbi:MAG: hypothetical protein KKA31_04895 [Candidatus Margulisbacteria bacterium]|nr:hypothetical protein [Candidatus Margulisiibacteriota bacterium]
MRVDGRIPGGKVIQLRPGKTCRVQRSPLQRQTIKIVQTVLASLKNPNWRHRVWCTQETAFAISQITRADEHSLRTRYQHYREALMQGEEVGLPHYYFKTKGSPGTYFLNEILSGRLTTDMHDVRGNFILLRLIPSHAEGFFASQRNVAYEVALTHYVESTQERGDFLFDDKQLGTPYATAMLNQTIKLTREQIPQVIKAIIVCSEDGGNFELARKKLKAAGLEIPIITDKEAILEAELLYRAALRYDLPTLLEEGRVSLGYLSEQEIETSRLYSSFFWHNFMNELKQGEIVSVNLCSSGKPTFFRHSSWGMVLVEEGRKKVVVLSQRYPREEETRYITIPRSLDDCFPSSHSCVHIFDIRRTGVSIDPQRVREIGLASALAEQETGVELII